MSYYGYAPYVSVAARRLNAEKAAAKAKKAGLDYAPIAPCRGAIAKTFWGKSWCDNLEHYSDYENRLPRGRTYTRNGSVIDLKVNAGEVKARIMGSSLYEVKVTVSPVAPLQWKALGRECAGSIDSLVGLLQGKLSAAVMERICKPKTGLFPTPKEIHFSCDCPDSASMCKHIAAVLYGIGARLDQQPELLFQLRQVEPKDLVTLAGAGLPKTGKLPSPNKVLDDSSLADVFGLDMVEVVVPKKSVTPKKPPVATKVAAKTVMPKAAAKPKAPAKPEPIPKPPSKVARQWPFLDDV